MVAEFVIPSLISLKIWETGVAVDFSLMKLCLAKRNAYQKIKSALRVSRATIKSESSGESKIHGRRESDAEMKTQELKLRSERAVGEDISLG